MKRAFARWRVRVWDKRLKRARAIWNSHSVRLGASSPEELFWEGQVTKALAKRVKWRKRAGIKLRSGGPVGKPRPYSQSRKLSPPPDRPES